jgi:hypothetical protein
MLTKHQAGQPSSRPSISGTISSDRLAAASTTPIRSSPPCRSCSSGGRTSSAAAMANAPSGTLTRNVGRQARPNTSKVSMRPQISWSATAAKPATVPKMPSTRVRASPGKVTCTIASTCGYSSAPPTPCNARAAIKTPLDGASPHAADAALNRASPSTNMRLRPNRAPRQPPVTSRLAQVSV